MILGQSFAHEKLIFLWKIPLFSIDSDMFIGLYLKKCSGDLRRVLWEWVTYSDEFVWGGSIFAPSISAMIHRNFEDHKNDVLSSGMFSQLIAAVNFMFHKYVHEVASRKKLTPQKYPAIQYFLKHICRKVPFSKYCITH